jgi:hypothetical protein
MTGNLSPYEIWLSALVVFHQETLTAIAANSLCLLVYLTGDASSNSNNRANIPTLQNVCIIYPISSIGISLSSGFF